MAKLKKRTDAQAEAVMAKWMKDNDRAITLGGLMHAYVKDRAKAEGTPFKLNLGLFVQAYIEGVREFFGATIHVRRNGDWAITDNRQPTRGFTARWMNKNFPITKPKRGKK
jgi:hypothetical protein